MQIQWKKLSALIGLDAAIIISWMAYHNYQPRLLEAFQFQHFANFLVYAKGVVLAITPPIAGWVADKYRIQNGHSLPIMTIGISVTAMIFMAVAFIIAIEPSGFLRSIFPIMIVLWLISMNIFHSPAISTVELMASPKELPFAMAIFTLVADFLYALEPIVIELIDFLGAPPHVCHGSCASNL